jgi:hypothetical protein
MATLPTIPASLKVYARKIATDIATTAAAVGSILAVLLNVAPSLHVPSTYIAWIVTASSVVAAVVAQARRVAGAKLAAKHAPVPVPVPVPAALRNVTVTGAPAHVSAVNNAGPKPTVKKAVKKAPAKKAVKAVKKTK